MDTTIKEKYWILSIFFHLMICVLGEMYFHVQKKPGNIEQKILASLFLIEGTDYQILEFHAKTQRAYKFYQKRVGLTSYCWHPF